jgi:hypothetical protein
MAITVNTEYTKHHRRNLLPRVTARNIRHHRGGTAYQRELAIEYKLDRGNRVGAG